MHSSEQKGNKQPRINRIKGRNNKWGGNRKENQNDDKNMDSARGNKKPKWKVKFPCKLCGGHHLSYLFPCIEDASKYIAHILVVLTNPLAHN